MEYHVIYVLIVKYVSMELLEKIVTTVEYVNMVNHFFLNWKRLWTSHFLWVISGVLTFH